MRYITVFLAVALFSLNAQSAVYKCKDKVGRLIFQDTPCGGPSSGIKTKDEIPVKPELSGDRLDQAMWLLLEEPYRSDDKKFIAQVTENRLLHRKDSDGDTVFSVAALNGQTEVMDYLVKNGASVDSANNQGYTILSFAAKLNDQVKAALIHCGADINHSDGLGHTPLINAVLMDDLETVTFLLSHGAITEHLDDKGGSALFYAAARGDLTIVKALVDSGADVNIGTTYKPLPAAIAKRHFTVSAYLAMQGATR